MRDAGVARVKAKDLKKKPAAAKAKGLKRKPAAAIPSADDKCSAAIPRAGPAPMKLMKAKVIMKAKPAAKDKPLPKAVIALGAKIKMTDVFTELRKVRHEPKMYKCKFASRAYAMGRKRALEGGASDINAKQFGAIQYRKASELWG